MKLHAAKRMHNVKLHVDSEERPGWVTAHDRTPAVGEEAFCTMGRGEVSALHGRTGDGSRLLQIRLDVPGAPPFYAAASNVLVHPEFAAARRDEPVAMVPGADSPALPEGWLG